MRRVIFSDIIIFITILACSIVCIINTLNVRKHSVEMRSEIFSDPFLFQKWIHFFYFINLLCITTWLSFTVHHSQKNISFKRHFSYRLKLATPNGKSETHTAKTVVKNMDNLTSELFL